MVIPIVLSHFQVQPLLAARAAQAAHASTSVDLGLSQVDVALDAAGVTLATGQHLSWADLEKVAHDDKVCFRLDGQQLRAVRAYSDLTDRVYSLYPTVAAPTMLVSGLPMHRIKDTTPHQDTLAKIKAIAPIAGRVLDTCTGLGYTAIEAAKTAEHVITIELDPVAQEMARANPWSQVLFEQPKIEQLIGDAFEVITSFEHGEFAVIVHDPPMLSLGGELYSAEFYRQCHRVLRRGGKLFHYIGDPNSASGARTTKGVVRRLQEAGFTRVVARPQAFGVAAFT